MLFSEPKIPQSAATPLLKKIFDGFSALQRAENSSIRLRLEIGSSLFTFQCSSASRKFLNAVGAALWYMRRRGFSALQRAENSSIATIFCDSIAIFPFQCSSASRKFLNRFLQNWVLTNSAVSVLFSEPKIPQSSRYRSSINRTSSFQCSSASRKFLTVVTLLMIRRRARGFSALQRAENSSILDQRPMALVVQCFSALQRAENSSIQKKSIKR